MGVRHAGFQDSGLAPLSPFPFPLPFLFLSSFLLFLRLLASFWFPPCVIDASWAHQVTRLILDKILLTRFGSFQVEFPEWEGTRSHSFDL